MKNIKNKKHLKIAIAGTLIIMLSMAGFISAIAEFAHIEKSSEKNAGRTAVADIADKTETLAVTENETAADDEKTIDLGECFAEENFNDDEEIEVIAEEYSLGDPDDIAEIIYVPIVNMASAIETKTDASDNNYYVKKNGNYERSGSLIRSSTYRYPGGTMKIGQKPARSYSFNAEGGASVKAEIVEAELKLKYGFSVTSSDYVEASQNIKVKAKHKRNVKAYRNLITYDYKLWKKRKLLSDKLCGAGKVNRPIGVIFVIEKNEKL